jgi:hypothetical protein
MMWFCYVTHNFKIAAPPPNAFHRLMQRLILGIVWRYEEL